VLARYPHLRPKEHIPPNRNVSAGQESFDRQLTKQQDGLAGCNKRILRKLDPEQRNQLSALAFELSLHVEEHVNYARRLEELKRQIAKVKQSEKAAAREIAKIDSGLKQLSKISESISDPVGSRILAEAQERMPQSVDHLGWSKRLEGVLQTLNVSYLAMFAEDPGTLSMVQLYWLFRSFGLGAGESELRVGLIRNGLWKSSMGRVRCVTRRLGDQIIGCDAVRKAVQRFHLAKGTARE
jgi:hypothetical protein